MTKAEGAVEEHRIKANGLEHRVLEWLPESARAQDLRGVAVRNVFLVHGFLDAAGTWDLVAPALAARGHRVLAPDMRGFGGAPRAPRGSYYHFADYIADLADMIAAICPGESVALVGHSMGGTITTLYAGAFPEHVVRVANLEGLGPPDNPWDVGPTRMRRWIDDLRALRARGEPQPQPRADARLRLGVSHPTVAPEVLDRCLPHLVQSVAGDVDAVLWRYDPLHRTTSPMPFFAKLFASFARAVRCPVLFVSGGASGFHVPDEDERLAAFATLERATLEGAGHMLHWTRPRELTELLLRFLT